MRRPTRRTVLSILIPVLVIIVLVAAWAIDTRGSKQQVERNVTVNGESVGRLDHPQLTAAVHEAATAYARTPVEIRTTEHTYDTTAGTVGLVIDEPRTVAAALAVGRDDPWYLRPVNWLASFAHPRAARLRFAVRSERLTSALATLEGADGRRPVEPSIIGSPTSISVQAGTSGFALDPRAVAAQLITSAQQARNPVSVSTEPVEHPPTVSQAAASALATTLTERTADPLVVTAGHAKASVPPATVRGWLGSKVEDDEISPTVDTARVIRDLDALLTGIGRKKADAKITIVGGKPKITPSIDGTSCCTSRTGEVVLEAIMAGAGHVTVPLVVVHPKFTTADAKKLGIKQAVGTVTVWNNQPQVKSFTTHYQAGQPRVTNIHRIADLVRGAIVMPGHTFSVNDYVGQRTTAKKFVVAGAIADGEESNEVGGGVSQFATTLFNAAFFAGLDFGEYQSHSIHFDRYPIGREATMGYPHPDLQIRDNTPYALMIWTSYTATSVTVTFYSTQWVFGQQTAQTSAPQGNCTRVTTTRTRTYSDGHTATDKVFAVYRPDYGINC